jgi:two-component system sensor histidine kinase GlrK
LGAQAGRGILGGLTAERRWHAAEIGGKEIMKLSRPRTLLGLILLGLALLTLPLLLAVAKAALELGELTQKSEAVVNESLTATLENQRIAGLLSDMERNARQYLVLQDEDLLALYVEGNGALMRSVTFLSRLPQQETMVAALGALASDALWLEAALSSSPRTISVEEIVERFQRMALAAREIGEGMRIVINDRLAELEDTTRATQQTLAWQAAALLPGTAALIVLFLLFVGRPMRQIDRAIRALGEGEFQTGISISGPRDIQTLGRQLEWLRDRLQENTEEKNKFLRHMSHELKTPLANIREGTELLLDGAVGKLDQRQQEVTSILRDNGIKLQKLIENLLTFSAWQTKTAALELSEFELKPLLFSVLSQHRLALSSQKIRLQLDVAPLRVHADEGKLRLVLENLISNAIKFTPERGTIHVGAVATSDALIIEVADNGPGVAEEDGERIFEAFYQGRRPQGGRVGGTGIGLSVVAECVQAHGGTVELIKGQWSGAHFRVCLPARDALAQPQAKAANA